MNGCTDGTKRRKGMDFQPKTFKSGMLKHLCVTYCNFEVVDFKVWVTDKIQDWKSKDMYSEFAYILQNIICVCVYTVFSSYNHVALSGVCKWIKLQITQSN